MAAATSEAAEDEEGILSALRVALESAGWEAGITGLERLGGGASKQNWAFVIDEGEGGHRPAVLRAEASQLRFAAAGTISLETEAALLRLAHEIGVPVPRVLFELPLDTGIAGYAMERVEGESIGPRILKDEGLAQAREQLAYQCGRLLAQIHSIPLERLPPLENLGPAEGLDSLEQRYRATDQKRPVFELAMRWLKERLPSPAQRALVHGDFRNGNLIVGSDGVRAVLDWETSHVGAPGEDLGWLCVTSWRFGRPQLPVGGFGNRAQLLAGYGEGGSAITLEELMFWEAFGTLRWGVMCAEVGARFEQGVRSIEGAMIARRASETEYDLMNLMMGRTADAG